MTNQYRDRATIAPCATLLYESNQLALCLGESPDDDKTFAHAGYQKDGNTFGLCSTVAKPIFLNMANSELVAPEHAPNVDLAAARKAQAALLIGTLEDPVTAAPGKIAVIVGNHQEAAQQHIAALGLMPLPSEEESLQ